MAADLPMTKSMSTSSINSLAANLQTLFDTAINGTGQSQNTSAAASTGSATGTAAASQSADSSQLSPLAQLMSTLQQLQQSNPTQYQQVTQAIGANLEKAASTAQAQGNTAEAKQLTQLASDFTSASKSGQLPNIKDLAQAIGGGHHHGHANIYSGSSDSNSDSGTSSGASTSDTSSLSNALLSSYQTGGPQNQSQSLNPSAIIFNTLASAGISLGD